MGIDKLEFGDNTVEHNRYFYDNSNGLEVNFTILQSANHELRVRIRTDSILGKPQMLLNGRVRKTIFWVHLVAGITAGLAVVVMSATGVILTYQRQMVAWADRVSFPEPGSDDNRLSISDLQTVVARDQFQPVSLTIFSDPSAPITASAGRQRSIYINPYTGEYLGEPKQSLRGFFATVTEWHRYFDVSADNRTVASAVIGFSNLVLLFLLFTGMYLWLPRILRWPLFRARLLFQKGSSSSKQRDFNWHHVFGIWSAVPLIVVVATGVIISYPWAMDLLYRSVGDTPPTRGAGPEGRTGIMVAARRARMGVAPGRSDTVTLNAGDQLSLDALFDHAAEQVDDWGSITVQLPREQATSVNFTIDQGNNGLPLDLQTLVLNSQTGDVERSQMFTDQTSGVQARGWIRFLHTGEALGLVGQAVAGIVSLASLIMVWTGFALAYRRLIQPLFRKVSA